MLLPFFLLLLPFFIIILLTTCRMVFKRVHTIGNVTVEGGSREVWRERIKSDREAAR